MRKNTVKNNLNKCIQMARANTSTGKKTTTTTTAASKKKETVAAPTPVPVPEPTPVPVAVPVPAPVPAEDVITYAMINAELVASMQRIVLDTKDAIKNVRAMKTMHEKELKENKNVKKVQKRPRTQNAGFAAPTKITPQLAKYLGVSSDKLSRTEAVKMIHEKIKSNNLQDENDKRTILYTKDKELQKLLNLPAAFEHQVNKRTGEPDIKLTYFNLQRYISPHFLKE